MYKGVGDTLSGYAKERGVPYLLATDDVALSCAMTQSFASFLLSFSQLTSSPDKLAILFYLMAGNCTEFEAWQAQLRYLRAIYAGNSIAAQDARIVQQRYLAQAARRQLKSYHYLTVVYAQPGDECPLLKTDNDQLYWLLGLISGLQAALNDIAAAGKANVPLAIGGKIERAAACLDSQKWWGIPAAIQATLWLTIPSHKASDKHAKQVLNDSLQTAVEQGIAINHVFLAQVYLGLGNNAKVKQVIRDYSELKLLTAASQDYQLLNKIAKLQLQHISDRLWTEATGKRTPIGQLGRFWDDPATAVDTIELERIYE